MIRAVLCAWLVFALLAPGRAGAAELDFWDLKPEYLRSLAASPQVMVTHTPSGFEAYCRCPVILRPNEIPRAMKQAIVAVEDKRFFDHGGVDFIAVLAVLKGGVSRGASTIPMQLLKNLVFHDLQHRDVLSRFERKGSEFWHAGTFDGALGKEELLAAYLNQIEFGGRDIVGLYRAARHYFRKEPKDLTLYESALLAGMVQAPARFNPLKPATQERAHERARLVLDLMVKQNRITEAERRRAVRAGLHPGLLPEFKLQPQAFTEWVVQNWGARYVKPGETVRFFVTLDPRVQHAAERHLGNLVQEGSIPPAYEAAAVLMAPDGRVRAMIGSIDWSRRQFNGAVKANAQAGSTAKLPLLVAACESGRRPNSRVLDRPITADWPSNGALGYRGETTLAEAFAASRNAAAVRLAHELGPERVAEVSRRLGVDPGPKPDAGFVLGPFSTNVLTMTAAYAAVANDGRRAVPTGVLAVVDGRGHVLDSFLERPSERVISERCLQPIRAVLNEVVRSGTGHAAALSRWKAYGKTGTSTGNADAWFVGWSDGGVLGVWMGRARDTTGPVIAGKDAPSDLFKRVLTSVNEMEDARQQRPGHPGPAVADRTGPASRPVGGTSVVAKSRNPRASAPGREANGPSGPVILPPQRRPAARIGTSS